MERGLSVIKSRPKAIYLAAFKNLNNVITYSQRKIIYNIKYNKIKF
jgi:hypothetical protein